MEFKGTKGEWNACFNWSDKNIEIGTVEKEKIALVSKRFDYPESHANAQLIICAFEMLELLKQTAELQKQHLKSGVNTRFINLNEIEKLIEKATTI